MKVVLIILLFSFAAFSQEVRTSYDKFKDSTSVYSDHRRVKSGLSLEAYAAFYFKGSEMKADVQDFWLIFRRYGSSWQFIRSRHLILLIDGERVDAGDGSHDGKADRGGGVAETMFYKVDRETFSKIANAKTVEIQLGSVEDRLDDKTLVNFKELLKAATR